MRRKLKFVWLDDEPDREGRATSFMNRHSDVTIKFINVKREKKSADENFFVKLGDVLSEKPEPDLVLVDHRLHDVALPSNKISVSGTLVAEIIRDKWKYRPVVCITGVEPDDIAVSKKAVYDELIEIDRLSESHSMLKALATSYATLRGNKGKSVPALIKLLIPPKLDEARLTNAIPQSVKESVSKNDSVRLKAKWIRQVLMKRPGFLYDRLGTATLLGLNEKGFKKVESSFVKAKYTGIFCDPSEDLWWKSEILRILLDGKDGNEVSGVVGRKLKKFSTSEYSRCHCGNHVPPPEVVGYTDEGGLTRLQMHLKCSKRFPTQDDLVYFDEIRMMKADDED